MIESYWKTNKWDWDKEDKSQYILKNREYQNRIFYQIHLFMVCFFFNEKKILKKNSLYNRSRILIFI